MSFQQNEILRAKKLNNEIDRASQGISSTMGAFASSSSVKYIMTNDTGRNLAKGELVHVNLGEYTTEERYSLSVGALVESSCYDTVMFSSKSVETGQKAVFVKGGLVNAIVDVTDVAHKYARWIVDVDTPANTSTVLKSCEEVTEYRILVRGEVAVVSTTQKICVIECADLMPPLVYKATADASSGTITCKPMKLDGTTIGDERTFKVLP